MRGRNLLSVYPERFSGNKSRRRHPNRLHQRQRERFWSTIAEPGYVYFKIHGNEDGYNVFCPQTMDENSTPVRIRFVRPGEENHSLTVSSENDNVKVSYEVIEGGPPAQENCRMGQRSDCR